MPSCSYLVLLHTSCSQECYHHPTNQDSTSLPLHLPLLHHFIQGLLISSCEYFCLLFLLSTWQQLSSYDSKLKLSNGSPHIHYTLYSVLLTAVNRLISHSSAAFFYAITAFRITSQVLIMANKFLHALALSTSSHCSCPSDNAWAFF